MTTLNSKTIDIRPYRRARQYTSIGNAIGMLVLKVQKANMKRQAIRQLQSLTDAQLEDIGIPRYNIRRAVAGKMANTANIETGKSKQRSPRSVAQDLGHETYPTRKAA